MTARSTLPPPPPPEHPGVDWEEGAMPLIVDALEDALPLSRYGVLVGEDKSGAPPGVNPIWFDGDAVRLDINYRTPYGQVVLALLEAYALALALSRVGRIPVTPDDVRVFEEALYCVFFEARKHHVVMADAYRHLGMPDLRKWLRAEMRLEKTPIPPAEVN